MSTSDIAKWSRRGPVQQATLRMLEDDELSSVVGGIAQSGTSTGGCTRFVEMPSDEGLCSSCKSPCAVRRRPVVTQEQ